MNLRHRHRRLDNTEEPGESGGSISSESRRRPPDRIAPDSSVAKRDTAVQVCGQRSPSLRHSRRQRRGLPCRPPIEPSVPLCLSLAEVLMKEVPMSARMLLSAYGTGVIAGALFLIQVGPG